jgi:cell division protein FtsW
VSTATERRSPRSAGDRRARGRSAPVIDVAPEAVDDARGALAALRSAGRRVLRRPLASYHLVLGSAGLLLALGLLMVLSASSVYSLREAGGPYSVFVRQAIWVVAALPLAWLVSRQPTARIRRLAPLLLVGSVLLLLLTFVPGLGVEVNGNRNWIEFGGPFRLQPSELAKLALVVWGADVYTRKQHLLGQWKHLVLPYLVGAMLVIALVVAQGDLGTAAVLMAIVLTQLWVVGVPGWMFGFATVAAGSVAAFFVLSSDNRTRRVVGFLDPFADAQDTGYQAVHSIYAFGTGGWWGTGLGASKQKWGTLPEAHTDFIYAVIGEELGLFGSLVVLALVLTLGFAGVRIATRTRDPFVRLVAAGTTGWLMCQAMVNLGAVLGMLPVTGIPLPLVSYGGSALLPTVVAIGLLLACAREEPGAAAALAARQANARARRAARRVRRQQRAQVRRA